MSTPTPFINSYVAGSCFYPYIWPNQVVIYIFMHQLTDCLLWLLQRTTHVLPFSLFFCQLIQAFNSPLQYDSLHDKINLENHHTVDGVILNQIYSISAFFSCREFWWWLVYLILHSSMHMTLLLLHSGQGSALTSSDEVQMTFSVKNLDSMKPCDGNLQPRSSLNKEFIKNGKELSVCKTERDGVSWRYHLYI